MPERERLRANKLVARLLTAMIVACGAMILAVVVLEANLRNSERHAREKQTQQLRAGCARAVQRDEELWGTNHDLAGFAQDASKAWRDLGNLKVSRKYAARERAAEARMVSVKRRLPDHSDKRSVKQFCLNLYLTP
jgi:hypothetical protein